jgi:hypothetical protein
MPKLVASWKKLAAILADRKVSPEERAEFLEALADLIEAVLSVALTVISLKSGVNQVPVRAAHNLRLTAADLRKAA